MREAGFALVLVLAAACIVVGVAHWSHGVAWCVAGVLLAPIGWLVLGGDGSPATAPNNSVSGDGGA